VGLAVQHDAGQTDWPVRMALIQPSEREHEFVARQATLVYRTWGATRSTRRAVQGGRCPNEKGQAEGLTVNLDALDKATERHETTVAKLAGLPRRARRPGSDGAKPKRGLRPWLAPGRCSLDRRGEEPSRRVGVPATAPWSWDKCSTTDTRFAVPTELYVPSWSWSDGRKTSGGLRYALQPMYYSSGPIGSPRCL